MTTTGARHGLTQTSSGAASASATRAAIYLRVSTGRQAEHDLSIPDQKAQTEAWVAQRGWSVVAEYVEPGASATDDKRPQFQRMIERACDGEDAFDVIVVHSFSRFFRDAFGLEFYLRKLAKHGVKLVSITQELGDDPAQVMMRQVIALFDEYQSKENAKHVLRSMKENTRQGFWNGSRPPLGYKIVEAERRGVRAKKKLAIDPIEAETVRLVFRLFVEGDDGSGPMGVKAIASWLNEHGHRTRGGGLWGLGRVHSLLTNPVYSGRQRFNRKGFQDAPDQGRGRTRLLRCRSHYQLGNLRCRAKDAQIPQPESDPAQNRERSDPADRPGDLCHVRRRHDAAGWHIAHGRSLSLLLLQQRDEKGQDRMQGALDPHGQARHPGDRASG